MEQYDEHDKKYINMVNEKYQATMQDIYDLKAKIDDLKNEMHSDDAWEEIKVTGEILDEIINL